MERETRNSVFLRPTGHVSVFLRRWITNV